VNVTVWYRIIEKRFLKIRITRDTQPSGSIIP
jgi:hypothetical protein